MKNVSFLFLLGFISIKCLAFQTNVSRSPVPDWLDPFPISKPAIEDNWSYYYLDFERQIHLPKQTTFHHYRYQVLTADGIQASVAAVIWIPYFNISETVKSTFCKTRKVIEPKPNSIPLPINSTVQQNGNLP